MPRNKYPEETVHKILDASLTLFLEKGYEQTTVLDIVNALGGLTRGAFYHHFKSKEEVLDALTDKMFYDRNPFDEVKKQMSLNGLEKLRWVIRAFMGKTEYRKLGVETMCLFQSPTFLKRLIDDNRDIVAPLFQSLIEEGVQDGSMQVPSPRLAAELFTMLVNFWTIPTIFPCTEEESWHKVFMVKDLCDRMGIPVFNEEMLKACEDSAIRVE